MQNLFGTFGNAVTGAINNANHQQQQEQRRDAAAKAWSQGTPLQLYCLKKNYNIVSDQMAANGVMPNDPRIQPYINQCNKQIALERQQQLQMQQQAQRNQAQAAQPTKSGQGQTAAQPAANGDASQAEVVFWESIKDSKSAADYQEYLKQYPRGRFAGLARNRIAALGKQPDTPATATVQNANFPAATITPATQISNFPAAAAAADPGKRVALIVGNAAYRNVPRLDNTVNDARLLAKTLNKLGFEVVGGGAQTDLDRAAFIKAVTAFGDKLNGSSVGMFYYAGHGIQMQGANFLVPIDANPSKPSDADIQLIDAQLILHQMEDSGAKLKVVVLDACRNNPFGGRGLRDGSGGLAQMRAPEGTLISYATQPGNVAQDGQPGGDSPFTVALVKSMTQPGMDVLQMFNEVGVQVDGSTQGGQQPWLSSSPIKGRFYFAGS